MNQGDTYVYGEYRGKVKKLDYRLGVGVTRSYYKQSGDDSYENYSFNPRLVLALCIYGKLHLFVGNPIISNAFCRHWGI